LSVFSKKIKILIILLLTIPLSLLIVFSLTNTVLIAGTVNYLDLEGGFYGIVDGKNNYDPIDLPEDFQIDGLRVFVIARISKSQTSFHMWGTIIQIEFIIKI